MMRLSLMQLHADDIDDDLESGGTQPIVYTTNSVNEDRVNSNSSMSVAAVSINSVLRQTDDGVEEVQDFVVDLHTLSDRCHFHWLLAAIFSLAFVIAYAKGLIVLVPAVFFFAQLEKSLDSFKHQQPSNRRRGVLMLIAFCSASFAIGIMFLPSQDGQLWRAMLLSSPSVQPAIFLEYLFRIVMIDVAHRFTLQAIIAIAALRQCREARNNIHLQWLTGLSIVHRAAVPIPLWFVWLENSSDSHKSVGSFLATAYLCSRLYVLMIKTPTIIAIIIRYLRNEATYGQYVKDDEAIMDAQCVICFDTYQSPVRMQCSHVYCEQCIQQWLQRENSCPMCRQQLANDRRIDMAQIIGVSSMEFYGPIQFA